jgi:hypothetical protein
MAAYVRLLLSEFVAFPPAAILGQLQLRYAQDGFASQYTKQTTAWSSSLPQLQREFSRLLEVEPRADAWTVLLEMPLYRLRRRIDVVVLTESLIVVVEIKSGDAFHSEDRRQVEDYALDLRDFHASSSSRRLLPVLWCTSAQVSPPTYAPESGGVAEVHLVGAVGLAELLASIPSGDVGNPIVASDWDNAPYCPVPSIIEAATRLFAGHSVREIAQADASNLKAAAVCLVDLISSARQNRHRAIMFLTGVPGSGKTLAGLQVVHDACLTGAEPQGDVVYLSGNTPLVTVLREALTLDEHQRSQSANAPKTKNKIRSEVRARIQHINDFLRQYIDGGTPHEHAIVFDEAQRAWDANQGAANFNRKASEPALLLEFMGRHSDWCACVCLVGGGQEINTGEQGIEGWGDALRGLTPDVACRWHVHAPPEVLRGGSSTAGLALGSVAAIVHEHSELQLLVPMRSYRSQRVSDWVSCLLSGDTKQAVALSQELGQYPIFLTRSLTTAREWLRKHARGNRRCGLVASSGARRLRADGLGQILHAGDGDEIAHWYLKPAGDIRSSLALEVPANEYTCQGLELDFMGLCWGGDLVVSPTGGWMHRRLNGSRWQQVKDQTARRLLRNSYRVLLTRAREGVVIWVPRGDPTDATRDPETLDATANFIIQSGARPLTVV